jgi:hypothetical protein
VFYASIDPTEASLFDDFVAAFGEPILPEYGGILEFDDAKGFDAHYVGTIVDSDSDNAIWVTTRNSMPARSTSAITLLAQQ